MADALTNDLFANSVTKNDLSTYQGNGVINYVIPWGMYFPFDFALPSELPPDWIYPASFATYFSRDVILRKTPRHEPFFAAALSKSAAKIAAKSFELHGNRVERFKQMLVQWGGDGYVPSQKRAIRDYLTTNNGAFFEIVRTTEAAMSRTLGLVHLDSLRVFRTNDPSTPYVFRDLKNQYHGLRDDQVIAITDMPQTELAAFGRGVCAADDLYQQIYKTAIMVQYGIEKVTGIGPNTLDFLTGITDSQVQGILTTAAQESKSRGQAYFQGHVISAILAQVEMKHVSINLRDLPDGYVKKEEMEESQLVYADRIGLDPQDLNPSLMGHGALGTGAQSVVLHEKQEGSTLSTYEKELTHQLDWKFLPDRMSFHFDESDLREKLQKAQISLAHAQTRQVQVANGEINAQEARQLAVEAEDMPADIEVETVMDEEVPIDEAVAQATQPAPVMPQTPPAPQAQPAAPEQAAQTQPQASAETVQQVNAVADEVEPKLNLNGAQVQAAIGVVSSVGRGEITREAGLNMLQIMFGMSEAQANRMLGGIADKIEAGAIKPVAQTKEMRDMLPLIALKQSIDAARAALKAKAQ